MMKSQLSLSASKLRDLDIMSKSDPMAVVYAKKKSGIREELEEVGRTEVVMNNLNPMWIQKINVAFHFEVVQPLIIRVYDVDTKYHNLSTKMLDLKDQDFIGEANCVLSEIMTHRSRSVTLKLHGKNRHDVGNLGSVTVHAEETIASKMAVEMRLRCSNLDNKDCFSKSDPFLRISRVVEAGSPIPICKTEVVNNNLDPVWKPLCITMQQYVTKVLKGRLYVDGYEEKELYSFLDYISSGFELNFMVAVDFTASNGDPRKRDSLHYMGYDSSYLNAYQQAIMEVGEVIQVYDYDKRFPAWGFGGKLYDGSVSHCFNLSGNAGSFEVEGVQGIMGAYKNALHTVSLHGPTLFGQVINQAAEIAAQSLSTNPTKYFVLLIITDGVLTDLQETKDAIVRASDLPLSILIVGVGNADFKQMEILDADTGPRLESSTGRVATRDIVQFVPMRDVQRGERSMVQALLEELPGQFLTYMISRDIKPLGIDAPRAPLPADPLILESWYH
ncbi:putative C2 domain, von Willebrand factor, type A, copine, protein BONZAI, C2 domain superfamily [Helianthus annuus]|uniref:C2 domain, von Willebrand factor, type A, copine, protein BONZAI, C2 domain superfamily n=1 Tax=Helianthus annuus TaxID=4232 RepID=A0A9K3E3N9_HELAN|nr:putative C2 domain, von Willebrand factor, type A, copine, protein BONZAI, C2 domain superfamily [Helianthus annuus]KAJ0832409.1 putative C2 domain, von Willebrand factor, type A, copine, protein BONZAI, C2 domain superfamily [Helianthus annuus]